MSGDVVVVVTVVRRTLAVMVVGLAVVGLGDVAQARETTKSKGSGRQQGQTGSATVRKPVREEEGSGASSGVSRSSFQQSQLEAMVFKLINAERERLGLPSFQKDDVLVKAARAHSGDMAVRGYFSHDSRKGMFRSTSFGDRLQSHGAGARQLAENIAMLPLVRSRSYMRQSGLAGARSSVISEDRVSYAQLAAWAVDQWMKSPGHRKNIVNPALRTMGIGAALGQQNGEDYVYLTQDFGSE